jgi:hypothetical protein
MLTLDYPAAIRAGDSDVVRLTLELDNLGNLTATAETAGNITQGEIIQIPNVYDTHNILAEARLDLAGVVVRPEETVSEPLLPGQKVTFYWSIQPAEVGSYRGMVWFYLRFVPRDGSPATRQALSAQQIEIEATSFAGIKAEAARWLGLGGVFVSTVLGLPLLEDVLRWLWKKKKQPKP